MNKRQNILIVIVIAIGVVLGGLILTWNKENKAASPGTTHGDHGQADSQDASHKHAEAKETPAATGEKTGRPRKGPKGGKLFTTDGFGVELTIFEKGVPP
ncbi:MAG: efflux transporter periplasmic adaptor subunit, partial [Nitrosospira sp.]